MSNPQNLKPFQPDDPRINRRGRPRKHDLYKEIARKIFNEEVIDDNTGVIMTRIEALLREWATSKEFRKQLALVQYAYGKVPDNEVAEDRDVSIVVNWGKTITSHVVPTSDEVRPSIFDYDDDDNIHPLLMNTI